MGAIWQITNLNHTIRDSLTPSKGSLGVRLDHRLPLTHIFGVLVEAERDKLFKQLAVISLEFWRVALGDEKEDPHGMEVGMRGLAVG